MTCRTDACTKKARTRGMCSACYERTRYRSIAYGRWESSYVDAQPVRAHILALRAAGISNKRLRELAGVSHNTIQVILTGRPERGSGPTKQVWRRTADKILAVAIPEREYELAAPGRVVPALGTTRRLQALVAAGYSQRGLCRRLGVQWDGNFTELFHGRAELVTAARARAVAALFAQLQMVPGLDSRARNRGRANGWPLPLDWDEDRIDDPQYFPEKLHEPKRDPAETEARREEVARLTRAGLSARQIAEQLGVTPRTIVRDRQVAS